MNRPLPHAIPDADNPFSQVWDGAFGVPPFAAIKPEHFGPAFADSMAEHAAEITAIAEQSATPNFDNTVRALEDAGRAFGRVANVFFALAGAETSDAIQAIERDISPKLAAHANRIFLDSKLYRRVEALHDAREHLKLTPEQLRVLERYELKFRRAGAHLKAESKTRLAAIAERLAALGTQFGQNVLADEQAYTLALSEEDMAGLPDFARAAAKQAASERKMDGYVVTLSRSSADPFLQFADRRDLREKVFKAWIARGDNGGATDNNAIIAEIVKLRNERAKLLGYGNFANYRLDDSMAKTPGAVRRLLLEVWTRACKKALVDRDAMQEMIAEDGGNFALQPWDWRYYAEKLRKRRHDVDEAAIKPYLQLDNVIDAAFDTANKLFGVTFTEKQGLPVWNPDVRTWEVKDKAGRHIGLFFGDYFARGSKHSGAWMTNLREQEKLNGDVRPLVINVCNFNKGADGTPSFLSFDDARTLFHELGHGLHGLLSNVTYPMISGTSVQTDFVELPSQLYEHWFEQPQVLRQFAKHAETGEPMPEDLLKKMLAARSFNQGFSTVEYVSSALVDLELHALEDTDGIDVGAFEKKTLETLGMPDEIVMRHRPPHFQHVFSGGGYASAYYSYMWSEVMDADAFRAFEETGDIFDPETAKKLYDNIYSVGGSRSSEDAYIGFRGRLPNPDALLARRGLADASPAGDA